MEWKEVRLGNVCEIYGRIGFRGYTTNDLVDTPKEGAISLSPKNIINGELNLEQCTYIKWDKYYESPEIMINPNEIVITKTGSSVGRTTFVRRVVHPMTLNPQLVVLKNISENAEFLSYYIKSALFQSVLKSIVVGSAIPTLSQKNLANIMINVPKEVEDQRRIASILSSLDRKIELNNKINADLEEMAQAIFKNWFVDFEPFKDGKFVDSELGMIPEGWKVGCLGDTGAVVCGKTPSKSNSNYYGGDIPFIKIPDMHGNVFVENSEDRLTEEGSLSQIKKLIPPYSLMVSCIATVGLVSINTKPSHTNQQINTVIPHNKSALFYLYQHIKNNEEFLKNMGRGGTTTLNVNTKSFSNIRLLIPSEIALEQFHGIVEGLFKKIEQNLHESRTLSLLRDTLLPRLMSGELEVPE